MMMRDPIYTSPLTHAGKRKQARRTGASSHASAASYIAFAVSQQADGENVSPNDSLLSEEMIALIAG